MTLLEEALTNRPFPQVALLSEQQFASFLGQRGLNVRVTGVRAFVESGLIEELDDQFLKYHPFQIWPICKLISALDTRLDTGLSWYGLDPKYLKTFVDGKWPHQAERLLAVPKSNEINEFNRRILPLLLWIESYFIPIVRGSRTGLISLVNANRTEWAKWKASIVLSDWLSSHSIAIEQLSSWREHVLLRALEYDPSPDLYLLLRSMPFSKRDRFQDRLRLAYDLYEIAEITRLFIEQVEDRSLRKEWHPTGDPKTTWVERLYGSQPEFGAPDFLRPLARAYGLDPGPRVRWLVEGETERAFVLRYMERLIGKVHEYVTVDNVRGDGSLKGDRQQPAVNAYLKAAKNEQCFSALTFDYSDGVSDSVQQLIRDRLITLCFALNQPDFELENFDIGQLVEVAIDLASRTTRPIKLCHELVVREVKQRIAEKGEDFKKALDSVLHLRGEGFRLSKGSDWGSGLAELLSDKRDAEFDADEYTEDALTKIERQILAVLRGSEPDIDFRLSLERLDAESLEIASLVTVEPSRT